MPNITSTNGTAKNENQVQSDIVYSVDLVFYLAYAVCIFGTITNLLNISVFMNTKLKDSTYKYYLANSVLDLFFLIISGVSVTLGCGNLCLPNYFSYTGQVFYVWFVNSFSRVIAVFNVLIEIYVSFHRLLLIKNKRFLKDISVIKVLFALLIISLLYYLPSFFSLKVIQTFYPVSYTHLTLPTKRIV